MPRRLVADDRKRDSPEEDDKASAEARRRKQKANKNWKRKFSIYRGRKSRDQQLIYDREGKLSSIVFLRPSSS